MERTVDGNNIALRYQLLERSDSAAANLLLDLIRERLVVEVEQLLAVKRLETTEHTLTDTADGYSTDHLTLKIVLILGDSCDVPFTTGDLLVGGDEVADEEEDGHDDVLGDRDDVGASDLGDCNTTVGLVCGIKVDVVRSDTRGYGDLKVLSLGETFCSKVARVESVWSEYSFW